MFGTAVELATDEVKQASALVKQLTEEVKKGVATKSDLATAMADLNIKAGAAAELAATAQQGVAGVSGLAGLAGFLGQSESGGSSIIGTLFILSCSASNAYHGYKRNGNSIGWALGWIILGFGPIGVVISLIQGWAEPSDSVRLRRMEKRMATGAKKKAKKKKAKKKSR